MKSNQTFSIRFLAAAVLCAALVPVPRADATVCFTSGKVYVQQKVYDKAAYFLECARKGEPQNIDVYSLLAFSRAQLRQYRSSGAAFQMGMDLAQQKKDQKKLDDMQRNRLAINAQLFNAGVKALNNAGHMDTESERTTGEGTPQAKIEKQYGVPLEFAKVTEGGRVNEFWYYPDSGLAFQFVQGSDEPIRLEYRSFQGLGDPQKAVTDTTVFAPYTGGSYIAEAAYNFELASYVDPTSLETYQNLAFAFNFLGRIDDSMSAARRGLTIKPDDERLHQNLRAAAMARGNRLYNAGKYTDAIGAYRKAMDADPASATGYQLKIADAFYKMAGEKPKGSAEQKAAYDSAATGFMGIIDQATAPDSIKQMALYNAGAIYGDLEMYPKGIAILDKGTAAYPKNKELWSLDGQLKFQANDMPGTVAAVRHALELDPTDANNHQFLFLSLNKLGKKEESVSEYTIYKALSQGAKKSDVKLWVNSADNRLGAANQLKTVFKTEGFPDEVYVYSEGDKTFETWFFWSKGKSFTFMEGQVFSKGAFPPKKSS